MPVSQLERSFERGLQFIKTKVHEHENWIDSINSLFDKFPWHPTWYPSLPFVLAMVLATLLFFSITDFIRQKDDEAAEELNGLLEKKCDSNDDISTQASNDSSVVTEEETTHKVTKRH